MRYFLFFLLILFSNISLGQQNLEYMGVIQLPDSSLISYRVMFAEKDGYLKGHSITDMGGAHETKSYVSGYFDDNKNTLDFFESGIVYTKSPVTQDDFCYVHFKGNMKNLKERQQIEGSFKGMYSNGEECINGEIKMVNFSRAFKKAQKLDKKIDRSIFISKEKKEKVNLTQKLDSLSINQIKRDEVMSVFTKNNAVSISLYDAGREDGDKISLWANGRSLLENYEVKSGEKVIKLPLENAKTTLKIKAMNNGSIGGNTVKIDILDGQNELETVTNLKAGETAQFVFLKKE